MNRKRLISYPLALVCLLAGFSLGGCPASLPAFVQLSNGLIGLRLVQNIPSPSVLALAEDGRVFYAEKATGRVRVLVNSNLQEAVVLDLPVNSAGARGLLGLALHPDFATNRRLYVFYSRSDTGADSDDPRAILDNRVVYFELDENNVAAGGEIFVASLPADLTTENIGGRMLFDQAGRLLVAFGAAGNDAAVQDLAQQNGKVLRLADDGSIPNDNPDPSSTVFARGFRDPTGFAMDVRSNEMFVLDRLADGNTEINRLVANGNFGFPDVTGVTDDTADSDPILLTTGGRSLRGLSFDSAGQYGPDTFGLLLAGEAILRRLISVTLTDDRQNATSEGIFFGNLPDSDIRDIAFNSAGTLFVLTDDQLLQVVELP